VLVIAARLIILLGLLLLIGIALLAIALVVGRLRLLLVDLRAVDAGVRARRRIARTGVAAVGRIDVVVILRHVAAGGLRRRRQIHGIAGSAVLLFGRLRGAGNGIVGAAARIARQRHLGRAGQRHRGVEHALLLHQRVER